jgi:hypothetical protein
MEFKPGSGNPRGAEIQFLAQPFFPPSTVEIVPSGSDYPAKPGLSDSTESVLVPLVNQFGLMQQQMFDQFQQAMSVLVQMFGKMHRDQMEVIREELDRLRELTQEIQSLKDELAKRTEAQSQPVSDDLRRTSGEFDPAGYSRRKNSAGTSPIQTPNSKLQIKVTDTTSANSAVFQTGSAASSPHQLKSGVHGNKPSDKVHPSGAMEPASSGRPVPLPTRGPSQPSDSHFPNSPGDLGSAADDKDTIIWLHQRIMSIQSERESRWQKILKLIPGNT